MSRYRLNERSGYCTVPVFERVDGESTTIHHISVYSKGGDVTLIFTGARTGGMHISDAFSPRTLTSFRDEELADLSKGKDLPLDELMELRELEREYRARQRTQV